MSEDITSPCIKICVIDECSGLCFGCLRTLDEIAAWGMLQADAKREILHRLETRRAEAHRAIDSR